MVAGEVGTWARDDQRSPKGCGAGMRRVYPYSSPPAAQGVLEFGQYEAGQRGLVTLQPIPQGRRLSLDDRVKRGVLRPMALVAVA